MVVLVYVFAIYCKYKYSESCFLFFYSSRNYPSHHFCGSFISRASERLRFFTHRSSVSACITVVRVFLFSLFIFLVYRIAGVLSFSSLPRLTKRVCIHFSFSDAASARRIDENLTAGRRAHRTLMSSRLENA